MGLDFGDPPGGYGWIFPKEDHLNIGLGGWRHVGPSLRERLFQLVRFYGFETEQVWGLRGFHLPIRRNGSPLVDGNVLLVGDAAGLIDTLTGEGIYAALHSGRKAAKHISAYLNQEAPDLEGYRRELEQGLLLELRVSGQFNDIFNLWARPIPGRRQADLDTVEGRRLAIQGREDILVRRAQPWLADVGCRIHLRPDQGSPVAEADRGAARSRATRAVLPALGADAGDECVIGSGGRGVLGVKSPLTPLLMVIN